MGTYLENRETQKVELHFEKSEYMDLPDETKKKIKSAFLWGRNSGCWISRGKFPSYSYMRAKDIGKELGLEYEGKQGEMLTFEEQMQVKAEKAEHRAERYEARAEKAYERGQQLQKPLNNIHGDIAFFTQPNINSSAGRAFTNQRNRMFAAYDRGFEEFKKSEYYEEAAARARETKELTKPTDKTFCERRIADAEKVIRAQKKNLKHYEERLEAIRNGKKMTRYDGTEITEDDILEWIETAEDIIENNISKSLYYHLCLEELGGVQFSKENVKIGSLVQINKWGGEVVEVVGAGPKNFKYRSVHGIVLQETYGAIIKIVKEPSNEIEHPFEVFHEPLSRHLL